MNIFVFTSRYIRHQQTARAIVVNSVYFFFAISSQVTKASSEVCSSTTLPNLMESLERNTPHYKLPPTCWRPTPLCKTPLKRWNNLFGRGGGEFGGTSNATTPGGSAAPMPTAPPTSETAVWGITWVLISGDKIVKFSWHAGRGFAIVRWKTTVPAVGRKNSNSHTGAKSQSWTALRPKVLVNLHPLPHSFKAKPHPLPLKKARPAI